MIPAKGYAANGPKDKLKPFNFERRELLPDEILIDILYCGVCHSDIHQVRNEWGSTRYPIVPGHEIVGKVIKTGSEVSKFKVGDIAGVGCLVDSCRTCSYCQKGLEQYCKNGNVATYNSTDKRDGTNTYGGYSSAIVVPQEFALTISPDLSLEKVAPLLCAGITTYSPLRHWNVKEGSKVGVVGLGGLGHMAVKLASSFGAEVTMISTTPSKEADAKKLGAAHFLYSKDKQQLASKAGYFDYIVDTVSAAHNYMDYLSMLNTDGIMICVGAPPSAVEISPFNLIGKRRSLVGSLIGGLPETQEMLDYCAKHNITSEVEVIPVHKINEAYERMMKGDVKYRFVIDMKTL